MSARLFDKSWIDEKSSASLVFFKTPHTIVPAHHYSDPTRHPSEFHNTVCILRLAQLSSPNTSGMTFGRSPMVQTRALANQPLGKKPKITAVHPVSPLMCMFMDYYDSPNMACMFFPKMINFQRGFGTDLSLSETLRVGDMFAVKDCRYTEETLGENIVILRYPKIIVKLKTRGLTYPTHDLVNSTEGNWQVWFDQPGKKITLYSAELAFGPWERTRCRGFTCDNQRLCHGCFGKSRAKKPMVLKLDFVVEDCPNYDSARGAAYFEDFTSMRTTEWFCENIAELSSKHPSAIASIYNDVQAQAQAIVKYVNDNDGFKLAGWHRQGNKTVKDNGDIIMSTNTAGHITLLEPTNLDILDRDEFKALRIKTPTDDRLPESRPCDPSTGSYTSGVHDFTRRPPQTRKQNQNNGPTVPRQVSYARISAATSNPHEETSVLNDHPDEGSTICVQEEGVTGFQRRLQRRRRLRLSRAERDQLVEDIQRDYAGTNEPRDDDATQESPPGDGLLRDGEDEAGESSGDDSNITEGIVDGAVRPGEVGDDASFGRGGEEISRKESSDDDSSQPPNAQSDLPDNRRFPENSGLFGSDDDESTRDNQPVIESTIL